MAAASAAATSGRARGTMRRQARSYARQRRLLRAGREETTNSFSWRRYRGAGPPPSLGRTAALHSVGDPGSPPPPFKGRNGSAEGRTTLKPPRNDGFSRRCVPPFPSLHWAGSGVLCFFAPGPFIFFVLPSLGRLVPFRSTRRAKKPNKRGPGMRRESGRGSNIRGERNGGEEACFAASAREEKTRPVSNGTCCRQRDGGSVAGERQQRPGHSSISADESRSARLDTMMRPVVFCACVRDEPDASGERANESADRLFQRSSSNYKDHSRSGEGRRVWIPAPFPQISLLRFIFLSAALRVWKAFSRRSLQGSPPSPLFAT